VSLIRRIAFHLDRWKKRPRFGNPGLGTALVLAFAAVLLLLLARGPKAAPAPSSATPPASAPGVDPRPVHTPRVELPDEVPAAPEPTAAGAQGGCPKGCGVQPPDCYIKGNISSKGERIYHVPGGDSYAATVISPEKGEAWFCTEEEARANGWRKSKR
jgi:hypothetical protein